jgi:co-chaperonin GroES (HSP10)
MIVPAGHKVLIRPTPVAKYRGSIELVINEERELAATTEGEIVALGETAYLKVDDGRPWVKPGDKVIYAKYAGALAVDPATQEKFVVVHDVDIICIIKETNGE